MFSHDLGCLFYLNLSLYAVFKVHEDVSASKTFMFLSRLSSDCIRVSDAIEGTKFLRFLNTSVHVFLLVSDRPYHIRTVYFVLISDHPSDLL